MEANYSENVTNGLFVCLMESQKLFLVAGIMPADIALLCNCPLITLQVNLYRCTGLFVGQLVNMYRLQYAKELLLKGVSYRKVWKYSGFPSFYEMDRLTASIAV